MIYGFYIIDIKRGIPLISRTYKKFVSNEDILPSFVSALWIFSESELSRRGEVNEERLGKYKWVYTADKSLIFLIIADLKDRGFWLKSNLKYLKEEFYKSFPEAKDESILEKWSMTPARWKGFESVVDEYLKIWSTVERRTEMAKTYDITEVFQKIFYELYGFSDDELKKDFYDVLRETLKVYDLLSEGSEDRDVNLDKLPMILSNTSYRKAKALLLELYKTFMEIILKKYPIEFVRESLRERVFPIIKKELKRLSTYRLIEHLLPYLLV
ncbi:MAG: hypothetical protein ACTSR0_00535 [Candidatus Asgardarchaeia archaeon]